MGKNPKNGPPERALVTGGAGFIGSNFVRSLLADTTFSAVVVDKLTYAGNPDNLADFQNNSRMQLIVGDICDAALVRELLAVHRPTWIINFAAESHVDRSIDGPAPFVQTNIVGTFELLEASRAHWKTLDGESRERFRFLHVSTDEVYGSLGETGAFSESSAYAPNSPYAASKAAADHLVRAYHSTYGLPTLITNCSNNYGPFQFPEKLIPLIVLNALEGRDLPIYGDGLNVRDWLHVEDHCAGILAALKRGRAGEKYNFGGSEQTNQQVVERICAAVETLRPAAENPTLKARGLKSYLDLRVSVPDRPGHDRRYAVDSQKARAALGWQPKLGLEAGIPATVRWYLEHRAWCDSIKTGTYQRERLGLAAGVERAAASPGHR
jgi:dTDP-glucose 4,6-dehydratase